MFNFKIRQATHADKNAICRIAANSIKSPLAQEELYRLYTEIIEDISQVVMVFVHSGHVAGFIHARRVCDMICGEHIEIVEIAVNPYYQNRGGEELLLAALEKWSCQMLIPRMTSVIKVETETIKEIFQNCGFTINGFGDFEKTI